MNFYYIDFQWFMYFFILKKIKIFNNLFLEWSLERGGQADLLVVLVACEGFHYV
jgi:hypothetical protein